MASELDHGLKTAVSTHPKSNLTHDEQKGLDWLNDHISKGILAVVPADKGGAILIVYPDLLKKKTLEKLNDDSLYDKLDSDPNRELSQKLHALWVQGKTNNLVSAQEAKEVVGISDNLKTDGSGPTNRPSTLPIYKPGTPYFYPSPKIHKLPLDKIKPGVEPPVRLITALQEGVTKRSDVFLCERFLRPLELDYCKDLLKDTNDTLTWLDETDSQLDHNIKRRLRCFSFDFKALYDSLSPALVIEALNHAMITCRTEWSEELRTWIIDLVKHSFKSSVGMYDDIWYRQKNGVPTGGTLCVQLANITVFHVLSKEIYTVPNMMTNIETIKRFIDDGSGTFRGTKRMFSEWIVKVNSLISPYGLYIDEHSIEDPAGTYVSFLDIRFCFDIDGHLQTDLYVKETDARSYLFFGSSHANHVFAGIVYSQCLRLRRIINNHDRLVKQLDTLRDCFLNCNYPRKMVNNIVNKVKTLERKLDKKVREDLITTPEKVCVVSTFGSDQHIVEVTEKHASNLSLTKSFSSSNTDQTSSSNPSKKKVFKYVKRTGSSLRNKFVRVKDLALGGHGKTEPCKKPKCKLCEMISDLPDLVVNGFKINPSRGICTTYNIIYLFLCTLCTKPYVGRTVSPFNIRTNQHRSAFYKVLALSNNAPITDPEFDNDNDDIYSLGIHLINDHNCIDKSDFNKIYRVLILEVCSPNSLEVKEHKWIHRLNSLRPSGINRANPFSIPSLNLVIHNPSVTL
jgi:hypothetical protein